MATKDPILKRGFWKANPYDEFNEEELREEVRRLQGITTDLEKVVSSYVDSYRGECSKRNRGEVRKKREKEGLYPFVPFNNTSMVIRTLESIREDLREEMNREKDYRPITFLDAGCGIGNILMVAAAAGWNTTGIEFDPGLAEIAKRIRPGSKIVVDDIRTFESYGNYDVIYYWQPMSGAGMKVFTEKLAKDMRVGAFVIARGDAWPFERGANFEKFCQCVYKKVAEYPIPEPHKLMLTLIAIRRYFDCNGRYSDIIDFLDAGCGIGNNMIIADQMGFRAFGIEYNEHIFGIAKDLLRDIGRGLILGNILTYRNYAKYDVIFYYQPIAKPRIMNKFIGKLIEDMKVGAIIIPHWDTDLFLRSKKFERLETKDKIYYAAYIKTREENK